MKSHVGRFGKSSAEYYCRMPTLIESGMVASKLADSVLQAGSVKREFKEKADYSSLKMHLLVCENLRCMLK